MLDIKVRKKLFIIGVITFVYVLFLTVGYAFF